MDQTRRQYPSDLTDQQWENIKDLIPVARRGGRRRTTNPRELVNAIFYLNRTGCAWRHLPNDFPPWRTVYEYFYRWSETHLFEKINEVIVKTIRLGHGKQEHPSCVIIDSQSAKASCGEERGYDGYKKIRGRKRQILVDTLGLIHAVYLHSAHVSDSKAGAKIMEKFEPKRKLELILADKGYRGYFTDFSFAKFRIWPEIVGSKKTGNLIRKRWIVERTFAWFNHYRRLSRDYERNVKNSESMIYVAMIQMMLRKSPLERIRTVS